MNWFTRLFKKTPPPTSSAPTNIAAKNANIPVEIPGVTPPMSRLKQSLPPVELKQFVPLRNLDDAHLAALPRQTLRYAKHSVIFTFDQRTDSVFYLVRGRLSMQPDSDSSYEIVADTPRAHLPLNSATRCGATATALDDVLILEVSIELNRLWSDHCRESTSCVELVDIELPESLNGHQFFVSFAQAYRENQLRLPSLPDVALKLKEAMRKEIGIADAVEIIQLDPPIVAKLIQVANSALYSTGNTIHNCHDAVSRIGLNATRNLVLGISLKQLFHCKDPALMKAMQALWRSSLYVSSLSFVLAQACSRINPEDALLAGLVADIGAIPLLHFAEHFPDASPSLEELQASLTYLRAPVGTLVLHTLGFSETLTGIPPLAENWLYDSGSELTLSDIVMLAKLHSYFGSGKSRDLPYICSIPAYAKLSEGKLNPDFSLSVLQKAQARVQAAMQLLS
ncbi:cyclic nucleotide-binding protein [Methylomonas sp. LWB]|uniref:HDOD domain-containing protein n=1 Tax=Methylomonas sp. LWB TaxID=1905845 RepID=UPI0008DA9776|nr:HDOD domain-containing protein [Methylomonas sp. LWB]OHX37379.1 cyclic nucleotide-binding protein [Methylomonas sp. LWB]